MLSKKGLDLVLLEFLIISSVNNHLEAHFLNSIDSCLKVLLRKTINILRKTQEIKYINEKITLLPSLSFI